MAQGRCCCSLRPALGPAAGAWEACWRDLRPGLREAGAAGAERGCVLSPVRGPGSALPEACCWDLSPGLWEGCEGAEAWARGLKPALCASAAGGSESEDGPEAESSSACRWDLRRLTAAAAGGSSCCQRWIIWCSTDPMEAGCEGPAAPAGSSSEDDDKATSGAPSSCSSCDTPSACNQTIKRLARQGLRLRAHSHD